MASRLQDVIIRGDRASQPLPADVAPGTLYFVTDENKVERNSNTGTAWESYGNSSVVVDAKIPLFGLDGEDGKDGFDGIPGQIGPSGPTGSQGAVGLGLQGPPGLDAEESEYPWIIPGAMGPKGDTGASGAGGTTLVEMDISESELESLNSSPKSIVVAAGAGKILVPVAFGFEVNITTGYSTSPTIQLVYTGQTTNLVGDIILSLTGVAIGGMFGQQPVGSTISPYASFDPRNVGLSVRMSSNPGNPGVGVGTAKAHLLYATYTSF